MAFYLGQKKRILCKFSLNVVLVHVITSITLKTHKENFYISSASSCFREEQKIAVLVHDSCLNDNDSKNERYVRMFRNTSFTMMMMINNSK